MRFLTAKARVSSDGFTGFVMVSQAASLAMRGSAHLLASDDAKSLGVEGLGIPHAYLDDPGYLGRDNGAPLKRKPTEKTVVR